MASRKSMTLRDVEARLARSLERPKKRRAKKKVRAKSASRRMTRRDDNLANRGNPDRLRVNVNEKWELAYWTKRFGVSKARLIAVVRRVGPVVTRVEAALRGGSSRDAAVRGSRLVRNYDTGATLSGKASRELIAESNASEPTGAVPAYYNKGIWHYVQPSQKDRMRRLGHNVVTVYVEGGSSRDVASRGKKSTRRFKEVHVETKSRGRSEVHDCTCGPITRTRRKAARRVLGSSSRKATRTAAQKAATAKMLAANLRKRARSGRTMEFSMRDVSRPGKRRAKGFSQALSRKGKRRGGRTVRSYRDVMRDLGFRS